MALIENLERADWEEFLARMFEYTLEVLKNDRFRSVGSSVDDLRSWLAAGGVARVKERLNQQMEMRGFTAARQAEVNELLAELVRKNRSRLLDLMSTGTVAAGPTEWLESLGLSSAEFQTLVSRIVSGERPFDEWMRAHGHTDQEIQETYALVDRWLTSRGILPAPISRPDDT